MLASFVSDEETEVWGVSDWPKVTSPIAAAETHKKDRGGVLLEALILLTNPAYQQNLRT